MGLLNGNGEVKSNLAAVGLVGFSGYILLQGIVPWWAALVGIGWGLYLFLPNRMRNAGEWAADLGKSAMEIWKAKNK